MATRGILINQNGSTGVASTQYIDPASLNISDFKAFMKENQSITPLTEEDDETNA